MAGACSAALFLLLIQLMATDIDLELTDQDFQIIISKPEDFFDAELEVATVGLDIIENSLEASLEYQMRVLARRQANPNTTHPKILLDQQMITEKAVALTERMLDCRERLAGLKNKKQKVVQKMA